MSEDYYCGAILSGRVPVGIVAETGNVLAFHHVFPTWETHIIVIPKRHVRSLDEVDDAGLLAEMFQLIVRIIKDQKFAESNYKVITNGGSYQHNQHLHIHLVSGKPLNPN